MKEAMFTALFFRYHRSKKMIRNGQFPNSAIPLVETIFSLLENSP